MSVIFLAVFLHFVQFQEHGAYRWQGAYRRPCHQIQQVVLRQTAEMYILLVAML